MAIFTWKMHTVLNRIKNQFSDFYFLSYRWLYLQFTGDTCIFMCVTDRKKYFISNQIYRREAQWAETNEKSIFQFVRFSFFELWLIVFTIYMCVTSQKKISRSIAVKFTEKMRNELKRTKNQFSDEYFLSYNRFCTQNSLKIWLILSTKMTISQKLKIAKIWKFIFHSHQNIPQSFM